MKGEYNGLKALILKENLSAFSIHCFAHQLQLALVAVGNKHPEIETFFYMASSVLNVVGGSSKMFDLLREKKRLQVFGAISYGDLLSGRGLNQKTSLKHPGGDTRWGSHYDSLMNLILMFKSTIEVVEIVAIDDTSYGKRGEMILSFTDDLSKALRRKDRDIGCYEVEYKIDIPNIDEMVTPLGDYRVDLFNDVIDLQDRELKDRFSEASSDLPLCVACLFPNKSFSAFNIDKEIKLSKYYPRDFSHADVLIMEEQLEMYILDMRSNEDFTDLVGFGNLAKKLFLTGKHDIYPLLYKLLTLSLILPVTTASVERVFFAMAYVKNRIRNRIGDQWLNDNLVVYIEKDVFDTLSEDVILELYQ